MTKQELENLINKQANTHVTMRSETNESGWYSGFIESQSKEDLSAFIHYIERRNNENLNTFILPVIGYDPLIYTSKVSFSFIGWDKSKFGFLKKLFGTKKKNNKKSKPDNVYDNELPDF